LATVIIKEEGKPPPTLIMQGHPLMNFRGGKLSRYILDVWGAL